MIDLTIREPGVYRLSNLAYHSQICDAPSISSTGLRMIRSKSPAHFWAESNLNPLAEAQPRARALDFGNAAHSLILEGELPESEYAVTPFAGDYARNEDGWKAGDKREWKERQEAAGLIVVSQRDLKTIAGMAEAIAAHYLIKDGLFRGQIERALYVRRKGFWLKSKPDVIPTDNVYSDFKTAATGDYRSVMNAVIDNGYHLQIAIAIDLIKETTGHDIEHAALVVQEKKPPYVVAVYPILPALIACGRFEYEAALRTFMDCYERNIWPGYPDVPIDAPEWLIKRLTMEGMTL